jgi:hypothetical protein
MGALCRRSVPRVSGAGEPAYHHRVSAPLPLWIVVPFLALIAIVAVGGAWVLGSVVYLFVRSALRGSHAATGAAHSGHGEPGGRPERS